MNELRGTHVPHSIIQPPPKPHHQNRNNTMSNWNNKSAPMIWQSDLKEVMFFDIETTTRYKTFAEYQESDLNLICSAIGVYTISGGVIHKCHRRTNYPGPDITTCLPISDYDIWYDYLGEQTRIREIGGNVIVMLSNEGVEYLNDIANRVSSYTTTTV